MNQNDFLADAKKRKNNEFYTRLEDIEEEMAHYKHEFLGKTVYCNCDDVRFSNFYKYFLSQFTALGLKGLFVSGQSITGTIMPYAIYKNASGVYQLPIEEDENYTIGDFRSKSCLKLLEKADIVVTNPPFSLFREYVSCLMEYNKKFIIVGNINAVSYKEIFPLVKENKLWLGYRSINRDMYFHVPEEVKTYFLEHKKEGSAYKLVQGEVMGRLASACWFTNLDTEKRHSQLVFEKQYDALLYPTYDTYNAIHIKRVEEIPDGYWGVMGVPVTFLGKYNPEQFEIVGEANHGSDNEFDLCKPTIHGKLTFKRILIRRKQ